MIFSLPSYRRLSETDLACLRKDDAQQTSTRAARVFFNLLLLVGLWGAPLYARWVVLADLPKAVLGKWQHGEKNVLEFTPNYQVRLLRDGDAIETAKYRFAGDVLVLSDFRRQPGDRPLPVDQQGYSISLHGDRLTITPAADWFTPVPDNAAREGSSLRLLLPAFHGASVQFRRANDR
jgi:hypothetical protein